MNKLYLSSVISAALTIFSTSVLAHPGHDHSAESSNLIHLLWAAPILLAAVLSYKLVKHTLAKKSSAKDHS